MRKLTALFVGLAALAVISTRGGVHLGIGPGVHLHLGGDH
jgi:hypothetical protein